MGNYFITLSVYHFITLPGEKPTITVNEFSYDERKLL